MLPKYTKEDIYSQSGVLLYTKGRELTPEVMHRLTIMGLADRVKTAPLPEMGEAGIASRSQSIQAKLQLNEQDSLIFTLATSQVTGILAEARSQPWWMYISALSNYVDWVYTHSIDVALISLVLAMKVNHDPNEWNDLCLGAFLHDIGKLLIPKAMIQKRDKLSDAEMTTMRQHCDLGYSMLKEFHLPAACTNVILQHHERMDGSGYPLGLQSRHISREAQFCMVADTMDAITSYRPYRLTQNIHVALAMLQEDHAKYPEDLIKIIGDSFTSGK